MMIITATEACRRAGIDFKKGENKFKSGELSAARLAQIEADPRLSVQVVSEQKKGGQDASN